jgi:hypothetical protein
MFHHKVEPSETLSRGKTSYFFTFFERPFFGWAACSRFSDLPPLFYSQFTSKEKALWDM